MEFFISKYDKKHETSHPNLPGHGYVYFGVFHVAIKK